jgi:hypothetical protein
MFHFINSEPSRVNLDSNLLPALWSANGYRQGDGLSAICSCKQNDPIYTQVRDAGVDVFASAVMDDLVLVATATELLKSMRKLFELCEEHQLILNIPKTAILIPYDNYDIPEELQQFITEKGIRIERGAIECHGTSVGLDVDRRKFIVSQKLEEYNKYFDVLEHPFFPAPLVPRMLRSSMNVRAQYIASTNPPAICEDSIRHFGDKIISTFTKKLKLPMPQPNGQQDFLLRSPVQEYGWGLPRPEIIAGVAYLAAYYRATPFLTTNLPNAVFDNVSNTHVLFPAAKAAVLVIDELKLKMNEEDYG